MWVESMIYRHKEKEFGVHKSCNQHCKIKKQNDLMRIYIDKILLIAMPTNGLINQHKKKV